MERFFVYSRDHAKPIRLMIMTEDGGGRVKTLNAVCVTWNDEELVYIRNSVRDRKSYTLRRAQILSAAYARGDDGDTLRFERRDENENAEG